MTDYQCQKCGQPLEIGHNCDGRPFESGPARNSVPAVGIREDMLRKKGFHQDASDCGVYYRHPMHGVIAIYPGGSFGTSYVKTSLPLDAYLESLPDSSYTDILADGASGPPLESRCDVCDSTGPLFPNQHSP